jgi:hypothetical protein
LLDRVPRSIGAILSLPARHSGVRVVLSVVVENVSRSTFSAQFPRAKVQTRASTFQMSARRDAKARSAGGNIATQDSTPNIIATSNFTT